MKKLFTYGLVLVLLGILNNLNAQVKFRIGLLSDHKTYEVFARPDVTWAPPLNSTISSQLTLRVPTGGFSVGTLTSINGNWSKGTPVVAPSENPGYDYIAFALQAPTNAITYDLDQEVKIFSFENVGLCTGDLEFIDNDTDPFLPPNSQNVNIGNQISVAGAGIGVNAYVGSYAAGGETCASPANCGITFNGIDFQKPSTCGATDGYIQVFAGNSIGIDLQYSIDNGVNWQASNRFNNLVSGTYHVIIRDLIAICVIDAGLVELPGPLAAIVLDIPVTQPGCGQNNGSIEIVAFNEHNDSLAYSIDGGLTWQPDSLFTGLEAGTYNLRIHNTANDCDADLGQVVLNGCPVVPCFVYYELEMLSDGRYEVSMLSDTTWGFPKNIVSNMQITLKAPTGSFNIDGFKSELPAVTFDVTGTYIAPSEEPNYDYYTFGLVTTGTSDITFSKGLNLPLFTFGNTGTCTGDSIRLMNNDTDPFFPPNSQNGNVGQQMSVFGFGSADMPICLNENSAVECITTPVQCLAEFELEQLTDGSYQVAMTADSTFAPTASITTGMKVTIKVPSGGFVASNLTSQIADVNFMLSSTDQSPNEAPDFDYLTFVLSTATNKIPYTKGQKTPLFTFENTGVCSNRPLFIMDPDTDPFIAPNSQSSDVGLSIRVTGFSATTDMPSCYVNQTTNDCVDLNVSTDTIYLTIPTNSTTNNCIGNLVQLPNGLGDASVCANGTYVNIATTNSSDCVDIIPVSDFHEQDVACVVICDSNIPTLCDTTYYVLCPQIQTVAVAPICAGESVDLTTLGGAGNYSWSPTTGLSCTDCPDPTASPSATTTYTVSADDGLGCATSADVTVTVNEIPTVAFTANGSCAGSATDFINSTPSGDVQTWAWDFGDGNTSSDESPSHVYASDADYDVTLSVTTNGNCVATLTETITISPASVAGSSTEITTCAGDLVQLQATGGTAYVWSPATGLSDASIANPTVNPTSSTTYTVEISDATGCGKVDTVDIVVTAGPNILDVFAEDPSSCDSINGTIKIYANDGGNPLQYSIDGGLTWHDDSFFQGLDKDTYVIIVRSLTTNCSTVWQDTVILTSPSQPLISDVTSSDLSTCDADDGSISITASSDDPLEYSIDDGVTWSTDSDFSSLVAGTYNIVVRVQGTPCAVLYTNNPVIIDEPSQAAIIAAPTAEIYSCDGASKTVVIELNQNIDSYIITTSGNYNNEVLSDETLTFEVSPNGAENDFSVVLTGAGGCSTQTDFKVVSKTSPSVTVNNPVDAACDEANGQFLMVINGIAPFTYDLLLDGVLAEENVDLAVNSKDFSQLGAGTYTVSIEDDFGCSAQEEVIIGIAPYNFNLVVDESPSSCGASDGSISITNPPAGLTFEWTNSNNDVISDVANVTNLAPGTYNLNVSDVNGCTQDLTYQIQSSSGPSVTLDESMPVLCSGESTGAIVFSVSGGTNVRYEILDLNISESALIGTSNLIENIPAGTYELVVTDLDNNCQHVQSFEITESAPFGTLSPASFDATTCDAQDGRICLSVSGAEAPYTIKMGSIVFNNVLENEEVCFENLAQGIHVIEIQDTYGCVTSTSGSINSPNQPILDLADFEAYDVNCPDENNTGALMSTTGVQYEIYSMQGVLLGTTPLSGLGAGEYLVVYKLNGCEAVQSATINSPSPWDVSVEVSDETCDGDDGIIELHVSGANPGAYNYDWSDNVQNNLGSMATNLSSLEAYSVRITDQKGCQYNIDDIQLIYDCDDCDPSFVSDRMAVPYEGDDLIEVCLPTFNVDLRNKKLVLDGNLYTGIIDDCITSVKFYDYSTLVNQGSGPYLVNMWRFGTGEIEAFSFNRLEELVAKMNQEDVFGNWTLDDGEEVILGGNPDNEDYEDMLVSRIASNITTQLGINERQMNRQSIQVQGEGAHLLVAYEANDHCPDSLQIDLRESIDRNSDEFIVYSFSPNQDFVNETLFIEGIDDHPNTNLIIFNRWGNMVFQEKNYSNDDPWDGLFDGKLLPSGTYFYVIDAGEAGKHSGFFQIMK